MYQSSTYAGQKNKSVFVEMSERSAEAARLLQQAADPRPEQPTEETRSLRRRVASTWAHLLKHLAAAVALGRDLAQN